MRCSFLKDKLRHIFLVLIFFGNSSQETENTKL